MWADLSRDSDRTLGREVDRGHVAGLPGGTPVSTKLDIQLLRTEDSDSFLQDQRVDLAVACGPSVLRRLM